ncbi:unnamed protein product [Danaus chrysippus]|uniref:(African queen) hypothetical protein n=1 Tax=Danaus chrysippus TaxID=151541 RepID=A0A8J2R417_9NEOP|nr:unnamed protein product [Danaus chrysippus]
MGQRTRLTQSPFPHSPLGQSPTRRLRSVGLINFCCPSSRLSHIEETDCRQPYPPAHYAGGHISGISRAPEN